MKKKNEIEELKLENVKTETVSKKRKWFLKKAKPEDKKEELEENDGKEEEKKLTKKQIASIDIKRYVPKIEKGLTTEEVEARIIRGMGNRVKRGSSKSIVKILFDNIVSVFNVILFAIAGWLIAVKAPLNNLIFLVVIIANITIGIFQEIRAKRMIDKLSIMSAPSVVVVRDAIEQEIQINELVLDDIVHLRSGKQIPADIEVLRGSIEVNESQLTGESKAVAKKKGDTLLSGSYVVSGHCYGIVRAVGKDSFIEKMTSQAKRYVKPRSELSGSLRVLLTLVALLSVGLGAGLFFLMKSNMLNPLVVGSLEYIEMYQEVVISTAGAMVGMIPTGLFLLTSSSLAVGVIRLAKNQTLVQELYCIEMLARVDVLCLDKTGTITDGTMSVNSVVEYKNPTDLSIRNIISAMLNALEDGNETSIALEKRFGKGKKLRDEEIIPFSSSRKYSAVKFVDYGTFALGAPEFILRTNYIKVKDQVEKFSKEGFRILVIAHTNAVTAIKNGELNTDMNPVALIIIEDTIRPDAIETIKYFTDSGVGIRVISGDNPLTVARISERAGVPYSDQCISLEGLTDREVEHAAKNYFVFGRVSPEQKQILVKTIKSLGHTVAMTGDGVNDILALKEADTSIAMASGSEAVRNVSHLVLLDSNFSSMPKVVTEGRRVINNIQKISAIFLTKTLFSVFLAVLSLVVLKGRYPISPGQLILIDLFVSGIPSIILALEPNNDRLEGRFLWNVLKNAFPGALVVVLNSLVVFLFYKSGNIIHAVGDGISAEQVLSTVIVLIATFTSFMVLLRVSRPFNALRITLFCSMFLSFLLCIFIIPQNIDLIPIVGMKGTRLEVEQILLLLVIVQATYPFIHIVSHSYRWAKTGVRFIILKLQNIGSESKAK